MIMANIQQNEKVSNASTQTAKTHVAINFDLLQELQGYPSNSLQVL